MLSTMAVISPVRAPALPSTARPRIVPSIRFTPIRAVSWRMDQAKTLQNTDNTDSADSSKKKKRKNSNQRSKDSILKAVVPKTQGAMSIKKREHKNGGEDELHASDVKEAIHYLLETDQELELPNEDDVKKVIDYILETKARLRKGNVIVVEASSTNGTLLDNEASQGGNDRVPASSTNGSLVDHKSSHEGNGGAPNIDAETITKNKENVTKTKAVNVSTRGRILEVKDLVNASSNNGDSSAQSKQVKSVETVETTVVKQPSSTERKGDVIQKLELKCEETLRNDALQRLSEECLKGCRKIFFYPEVVKPDQQVEVFFNRRSSNLKTEHDVMIMGAFNDWKWKSFTIKLNKSHLIGDWWSCKFHVPNEAYKIDFVFYNGKDTYDNNNKQDFYIMVDSEMDAVAFENFLLEQKLLEKEESERQKAEKKKEEEELRRSEVDRKEKEADRAKAREEVAKRQRMVEELTKNALFSLEGVWEIEPRQFKGNDKVRLYYNKSSGPLSNSQDVWIHGGHDNWKYGPDIVAKLKNSERTGGVWWCADFVVPDEAVVLNWVFADGPPKQAAVYDNNHTRDFHGIVPASIPGDTYWVEEEEKIFKTLQKQRHLKEKEKQTKVERVERLKAEAKAKTLKSFMLSRQHILFTNPLQITAGSEVTLFYNPSNTVLNGKPEVWLTYSFNRWTYSNGPFPPQRMMHVENSSHLAAMIKVPLDAYVMDFVFSERVGDGIYDNNNHMDYHLPVYGGIVQEPPLDIVHISAEMAPIAKVGGLADVVTSLSRAIQDMNHNVHIVLPKYDCLQYNHVKDLQYQKSYFLGSTEIKVWTGKVEGLSVYFLEPLNGFVWAGRVYGCGNDPERFGFFCHAALEFLVQNGFHPDIIHCHDWTTAPVTWLLKEQYVNYGLDKARVIFTIHNLEFGPQLIGRAMAFADKSTTVSPTYAREVSENPVVSPHLQRFHGIINGIDPDIWDPYNDRFLPVPYTSHNVIHGKRAAKNALQHRLGLQMADRPMVGIISRLTKQKGIHLIKHAIWRTLDRGGQVVLLGSSPDPQIQHDFVNFSNQLKGSHHDQACLCLTYDEPLSHMIYAASDFILVPSIFEPCGLTQLTAMRYGSIPVVRRTGGLRDTVFDVTDDVERAKGLGIEPNGFCFDVADEAGVDYALNRAISAWYEKRQWLYYLSMCVMEQDWSWNRPALDYLELYYAAGINK
ncbi:starch synthase 3, chloroplastic/amyloplastic-like [Andrographis paniculata]|uniref:starch synthase 3, chloroplastic/amyloplastic-like n=1 Tax=Andrographis paniculata TaxID=175694 RepID=UPI0021E8E390|nr:starch synthase 3, chloroplastic/amyloplastic-like [Andrographis paniculata]